MSKHIIAAGHICLDITPTFTNGYYRSIDEALYPGKLLEVGEAHISIGGSVANTGLALRLLGGDVRLIAKIGHDAFGELLLSRLQEYGKTEGIIRSNDVATSYSVVLAVPGIDRVFLHNPGANNEFFAEDIDAETLKNASLIHFGYPPLMRSMFTDCGAELERLMKKAKQCGCATSMDMAAVDADSEAGRAPWKRILERTLPFVDLFEPSAEELCSMLDPDRLSDWRRRAGARDVTMILKEEDIQALAERCIELGAGMVLLKCGAMGMFLKTGSKARLREMSLPLNLRPELWSQLSIFEPSYVPDAIISGTGAGDTSIAAFLLSVLNNENPDMALHLAAATGACCLGAYDALSGLKPITELKRRINGGWIKNTGAC